MKYKYIVVDYPDGYQEIIARCDTLAEAQEAKKFYRQSMNYKCSAHICKVEVKKER